MNPFVVETAARARQDGAVKDAVERRTGRAVRSEAAALTQLAEIGARVVMEEAEGEGYAQLAVLLAEDHPTDVQVELGAPIAGEDPTQFDLLFEAFSG